MIGYESDRSNIANYFYRQKDTNLNFPAHIHDSFEFFYCYEGETRLSIDGKEVLLRGGEATLLFPSVVHSYATEGHSQTVLFVFSSSYIHSFYESYKYKTPLSPVFPFAAFEEAVRILADPGTDHYRIKSCLYLILSEFVKHTEFADCDAHARDLATKILAYVKENYTQGPSLKELAKQLGYSYNYVSGNFRSIFHTNFLQLVNGYRVSLAQHLLESTSDTVIGISAACGYDSPQSFNRNFLHVTGMTPSQYRARQAANGTGKQ